MGGSRGGTGGPDPLENNKLLYVSMGHHGEAFGPLWFLKKISFYILIEIQYVLPQLKG